MSNYLEVVLSVLMIIVEAVRNNISFEDIRNNILIGVFITVVPLFITWNFINNIYFLKQLDKKNIVSRARMIVFWIVAFIFLLILVLLLIGCIRQFNGITVPKSITRQFNPYRLVVFICQCLVVLNGFYLLIMQVLISKDIRKVYNDHIQITEEEIGT